MSSFKGKIRKHVIREIEKRKFNDDSWLQENGRFDHDLKLPEERLFIIENLYRALAISGYKEQQKLLDLEILIANLILTRTKPKSISLNRNTWTKTRYSRASYFVIDLIEMLLEQGFIDIKRGYKMKTESRLTRIWATEKLLKYCDTLPNQLIREPIELVVLRNENKENIDYTDTKETDRIRRILTLVNKVNKQADIRYENYKMNVAFQAIYTRKFTLYGRLHTKGYKHLQSRSEEQRKEITINGEKVVELDFKALHPFLLYAGENIQYPIDSDPYSDVYEEEEMRKFLKVTFLRLINTKSVYVEPTKKRKGYWKSASQIVESATNDAIYGYSERKKAKKKTQAKEKKELIEKSALKELGIQNAAEIISKFKTVHSPIAHHFCSDNDTGLKLMNKDAAIALDILNHFAKRSIPILAVHDSFIVQEKYKEELREVMENTYSRHTKGFKIAVK